MSTATGEPKVATPEEAEQALDGLKEKLDRDAVEGPFEDAKSSRMTIDLPGGGYIDDAGKAYSLAILREMTGVEEDILTDTGMPPAGRLSALLTNCVEEFQSTDGAVISDKGVIAKVVRRYLPIDDQILLVIRLRQLSLGVDYDFSYECVSCGVKQDKVVRLDAVDVRRAADPLKRLYSITLPSGRNARWRVPTVENQLDASGQGGHDIMTRSLAMRVIEVDKEPVSPEVLRALKTRDRNALRKDFQDKEANVDASVEVVCTSCATKSVMALRVGGLGFFFPTMTT